MTKRLSAVFAALLLAGLLASGCSQGQSYPTKAIEYVVHSSAGGGTDVMARTISDIMSKEKIVPQTLTVTNKTGGSGAVASAYVAEKKGDPYTIYNITAVQITTPLTGASPITMKDFTLVANLAYDSNCVVVNADSPYKTLKDLIDAAKSGKKLTQGGGSVTSTENMTAFAIKKSTGAQWEFASFNSGGEATTALLGNHVDFTMPSPAEVLELLRGGKIRVLAVSTADRLSIWPDVPTLKELGINAPTGFPRGIVMPKDVPAENVKYWQDALTKMRGTDAWKKYMSDGALADGWMTGADYGTYLDKLGADLQSTMDEMGLTKKK